MRFYDFEIRAWQRSATRAEVIVHNSPSGCMRKPVPVSLDKELLANWRWIFDQNRWYLGTRLRQMLIEMGQGLAQIILPQPVFTLLTSSLEKVSKDNGVRIRLCLDSTLIDLPWEYLYTSSHAFGGFLCLDQHISLVREPPIVSLLEPSSLGLQQRMIFAGMLGADGGDYWRAKNEYESLCESLTSVADLLSLDFTSAAGDQIEMALMRDPKKPTFIFHYAGDTNTEGGKGGYLVRQASKTSSEQAIAETTYGRETDVRSNGQEPLFSNTLGPMLRKAKTRLAVFSASNSGRWTFIEPLIQAGVPVIVGTQGKTSIEALTIFCHELYSDLALGLTLDEAIISARLKVFEKNAGTADQASYEWGALMVYMPSADTLLLPRPPDNEIRKRQDAAKADTQRTAKSVEQVLRAEQISAANVSRQHLRQAMLNKLALTGALQILCSDVQNKLREENPNAQFNLESVGGEGLEVKIDNVIGYLDNKNELDYLINRLKEADYTHVIQEYIKLVTKPKESDSN